MKDSSDIQEFVTAYKEIFRKQKEKTAQEGQEIKKNDPVITIESDKSSVEIPSIFSGKIESIVVKVGDKVSKDDLILNISSVDQKLSSSQDVPKNTENLIQEAESSLKKIQEQKKLIQKLEFFDEYLSSEIGSDKKSIAFKVTIQSLEKTLDEKDLEKIHQNIIDKVLYIIYFI